MILTILVIFPVVVLLALFYGWHRFLLDRFYRIPPGPTPLPFLGNFHEFFDQSNKSWEVCQRFYQKFGPIWTIYYGQYRVISLHTPEIIQEALVQKAKWFSSRPDTYLPGFNQVCLGIIGQSGDAWTARRRFTMKAMRDFGMGKNLMVAKIQDEVGYFVDEIDSRAKQPFEPLGLINNAVSNVICSLVLGKRFHYDDAAFIELLKVVQILIARPFGKNAAFFALPFLCHFASPIMTRDLKTVQKAVAKMLKEEIKDHRRDFNAENIRDFPDLFIQAEMSQEVMPFDFDGFAATMSDMFLAGTETTSTALSWTLVYLSKWPQLQQRCHDAIDLVIDTDRLPTLEDRPKLVFIDAVMSEVLRFASIVPQALFHATFEKVQLGGYEIPPNSTVMYSVFELHFDATYWKDPKVFRPDRWINSEDGKLLSHSSHFAPFGIGPRICLGESLARVEYFIFIVALLHRFKFSLPPGEDVDLIKGSNGVTHSPPQYKIIAQRRH